MALKIEVNHKILLIHNVIKIESIYIINTELFNTLVKKIRNKLELLEYIKISFLIILTI